MRTWVRSLTSICGLRFWRCRELWCRLQTQLGSGVAVAVSRLTAVALIGLLAWEPPYAMGVPLKRQKKQASKQASRQKDEIQEQPKGTRDCKKLERKLEKPGKMNI